MEEVNIYPLRRGGKVGLGSICAKDEVKVDKAAALVLGHLEVTDFELSAEFRHGETSIRRKTVTELPNCPMPKARRVGIPDDCALVIETRTAERRAQNGTLFTVAQIAGFGGTVTAPTSGLRVTRSVTSAYVNLSK